ncbi:hypothetical protein MP478_18405 [Chryseobacterium sp. WG14]|uniref:hypothetical protein n=1 Tax=Chryseobacterium sp. WG14 TaxID=2926909 RepID=UPI00211E6304|nr:hypothetical protein [Chryseobacterium sp. WG14]MCQ9641356.1 hypothetical protein [Chryseobacterium sp. WG14]
MKKYIIHLVPFIISFTWLVEECQTLNPTFLKGPEFLKLYIFLLLGFYASIFMLRLFHEAVSKVTFYGLAFIFGLGILKLIRGLMLGKPIGFLVMILIIECIAGASVIQYYFKNNTK